MLETFIKGIAFLSHKRTPLCMISSQFFLTLYIHGQCIQIILQIFKPLLWFVVNAFLFLVSCKNVDWQSTFTHVNEDCICLRIIIVSMLHSHISRTTLSGIKNYHLMLRMLLRHYRRNHSSHLIFLWYIQVSGTEEYSRDIRTSHIHTYFSLNGNATIWQNYFPIYSLQHSPS